ncbi:beta-N-acetylhexosaminidase [Galbibacter marinus]|uniref:beta-N-acetylhexosaminidase n=1 Tax=Galbibacter marinus TaxID=555500 RepID=K2Q394_9FLAO|nr:family 20 glycosylhydrolase [Galbibacter marinus]EKF55276.1 beta-N-acetylhexosaminidase [Galbibacter marinus]
MRYLLLFFCIFFFSLSIGNDKLFAQSTEFKAKFTAEELKQAPVKLIPFPSEVQWGRKAVSVENIKLPKDGELATSVSKALHGILDESGITVSSSGIPIKFIEDSEIPEQGYDLEVKKNDITIKASSESGQYYAAQTLRQLIGKANGKATLQLCRIYDVPAYDIRGLMIDVGRNYQTMEFLKQQLDIMAQYKLNVFQWHLTDRPAWRIESKAYPQLTGAQNHRPTRDPGLYYTYEQIRDLFSYAKERQIMIIPEIDMPGHSDSFVTSMGFKMESEQGMEALKVILKEFFTEIPQDMAPIIHIGSDEVEIDNPKEFLDTMIGFCNDHGRDVMVWNPGLETDMDVIRQGWRAEKVSGETPFREIDSWNSYVNNGEPYVHIPKLFFKPIGAGSNNTILGGILCLWNDVNVKQGPDIIKINPLYPSLLTYAWKTWTDDVSEASRDYLTKIPPYNSPEHTYFDAFEDYLMVHKKRYFKELPFQYTAQAQAQWKLVGPFKDSITVSPIELQQAFENSDSLRLATGNTIYIRDRFKLGGYFPAAKPGEVYYAMTNIYSETERLMPALIGFETPYRANRAYNGIPKAGQWDANGGTFWINGEQLPSPNWINPGWKPQVTEGWGNKQDQEIAWEDEELYWTREPVSIPLKKGWNTVIFKVPGKNGYQNWMFTFAPLDTQPIKYSTSIKN